MTDVDDPELQLRPSRAQAVGWCLVGGIAVVFAAWLVRDTGGHASTVVLLAASLAATAPWAAQLLVPGAFTWRLDHRGLVVRRLHRRLAVGWDEVRFARVVAVRGEPALQLYLRPASAEDGRRAGGARRWWRRVPVGDDGPGPSYTLRLPVGADLAALHRALARHLGPLPDGTPVSGAEGSSRAGSAPRPPQ